MIGSPRPRDGRQMLAALVLLFSGVHIARTAMNLPDGIENILGFVPRSSFQCERDGYFGDTENDCRIFHLCQKSVGANGRAEWRHWTYACGNQTMFNQLTLTCAFVDEAIPCRHASQFQYLNEVIHKPAEPFLTDADVTSGFSYYSNRIMSDGARARAFEDSRLMAQIGGTHQNRHSHTSQTVALSEPLPQPQAQQREPIAQPEEQPQPQLQLQTQTPVVALEQPNQQALNSVENGFQNVVNHDEDVRTSARQLRQVQHPTSAYPGLQAELFAQQPRTNKNFEQASVWPVAGSFPAAQVDETPNNAVQHAGNTFLPSSFDFAITTNHQHQQQQQQTPTNSLKFVSFGPTSKQQQVTPILHLASLPPSLPPPPPPSPAAPVQPAPARPQVLTVQTPATTTLSSIKDREFKTTTTMINTTPRLPAGLSLVPLGASEPSPLSRLPTSTQQSAIVTTTSTPNSLFQATNTLATPSSSSTTTTTTTSTTSTSSTPTSSTTSATRRAKGASRRTAQASSSQMASFQSARIGRQSQAASGQPGVIMRRQVTPNSQQASSSSESTDNELSSQFGLWQRAFQAQLMAPRFESLLTRRRV